MKIMPDTMNKASDALNTLQSIVDQFDNVNSCLRPIKSFSSLFRTISNVCSLSFGVHVTKQRSDSPICETSFMPTVMGCSGMSQSYTRLHYIYKICGQTIIAQGDMDQSVVAFLSKISHVYVFLIEACIVENVAKIKEPLSEICKLMPKCVALIKLYSTTASFCMSYPHLSFMVQLMFL